MLNVDKIYARAKHMYQDITMIKEHQMWGHCPTFRLAPSLLFPKGQKLYYDKGEFLSESAMFDRLREEWRPVAQDEREWFCKNL